VASRVTYLLEPKNWLIVTLIAIGAHADGLAGAGWGVLAAFFAAVLPTTFIDYGIRRGRFDDRNVGARRPRLVVLAFITASVATGLILLLVLGAPAMLTGYLAFMLISVAVLAAITMVWKISIHCAVASGSVTILALAYGPLVLAGYLLVGLLGWSRVAVRDHTIWQVIGGAVLGAAAAALAFTAFLSGRREPPLAAISPARRPRLSRPARSARLQAPAQRRTTGPGRIAPRRPSRPRRAGAPRALRVRAARPRRAR
jgi:membrane-associated phospholipid phosphatase